MWLLMEDIDLATPDVVSLYISSVWMFLSLWCTASTEGSFSYAFCKHRS